MLVTGEMFAAMSRSIGDEVEATEMTGVEHLGQYVYEMTKAKIGELGTNEQSLKVGGSVEVEMDGEADGGEYGNDEEEQAGALDEID